MRIYEGMFVLDDARWNENPEAILREVRGLLEKSRAKIFVCEKWDDRKLAYPIKHRNRGIYVLTRFTVPTDAIGTIERDCQLNDTVLRVLIVRDEASEQLDKLGEFPPKPGQPAAPPPAAAPAPPAAAPAPLAAAPAPPAAAPALPAAAPALPDEEAPAGPAGEAVDPDAEG